MSKWKWVGGMLVVSEPLSPEEAVAMCVCVNRKLRVSEAIEAVTGKQENGKVVSD